MRAGLTSERLSLVQARLSRHPNFATPLPGSEQPGYVAVTRIDKLSVAEPGSAITLLGTLTQVRGAPIPQRASRSLLLLLLVLLLLLLLPAPLLSLFSCSSPRTAC